MNIKTVRILQKQLHLSAMASGHLKHTLITIFGPPTLVLSPILFLPIYIICKLFLLLVSSSDINVMNKVVLITGASSGIGEQLAYEDAKRGAILALTARREQTLKEVAINPRKFGSLDVLVVPADVNFWGSIYRKTKGKIIVNTSIGGLVPIVTASIYCASKAAQIMFNETLRQELGADVEITIATLGFVDTDIVKSTIISKDGKVKVNQKLPEMVKFLPEGSAEGCAKVMLRGACRGKRHLMLPIWYWFVLLITHTTLPGANDWIACH